VRIGIESYLNGRFLCDNVELTFWETWPKLGIRLSGGCVLSFALNRPDTLMTFQRAVLSFSLPDYFWRHKLTIHRIALADARFYPKIDSAGLVNWDILRLSHPTTDTANDIPLILQRLRIRNAYVCFQDLVDDVFVEADSISFRLDEPTLLDDDHYRPFRSKLLLKDFDNGTLRLPRPMDLQLEGCLNASDDLLLWTLRQADLTVGSLPFELQASVFNPEDSMRIIDLHAALKTARLADALELIDPALLAFDKDKIKHGVDSLDLHADLHINPFHPDSSYALLTMRLNATDDFLHVEAGLASLFHKQHVQVSLTGNVDFASLAEKFIPHDSLQLQGRVNTNLHAAFALNDVADGRYDRISANGTFSLDSLSLVSLPYNVNAFVVGLRLSIDSARNDLLQATLLVDSLHFMYADSIDTRLSRLRAFARTSPVRDTAVLTPLDVSLHADVLRTRLPDSTRISAKRPRMDLNIRPARNNPKRPAIHASLFVDSLRYFALPIRSGLAFADFNLTLAPRTRAPRTPDSTRLTLRRQRALAPNDSLRPRSAPSALNALWTLAGKLSFTSARLFSRYFPLPLHMDETTVDFNANAVTFSDARLHAGTSLLTLSGQVLNLRRAFLRRDTLRGSLHVLSDHIDCNQLLRAVAQGMHFAEEQATPTENFPEDFSENTDSLTLLPDSAPPFFLVPQRLDLALTLNAQQVDYKDLLLRDVAGEIALRNQSVRLKKLEMDSNIGKGKLTCFYNTPDRRRASLGLDLDVSGVLVERLLRLYPSMDSLLPMLRSFEGILDGRLTALCDIDSAGNLDLASLNSLAFLTGRNLVLLDGETFAEISKTLMFKNKKRNVIDRLSVDLAVKDKRVEVFPFLLEMDRYRVAVAGTHHLDQSFNYHISVLKSPVPFKLGIDVSGTLDKPRYKITKCRYKNTFDPAREQPLIDVKLNLHAALLSLLLQHTQ
jgi:hypothetical protein